VPDPEIATRVRRVVRECSPMALSGPPADGDDLVDKLGYHSVLLTELALALGDEFGVDEFANTEFDEDIRTVGDVIRHAERVLAETSPASR
jgi:acyl carrier protein